MKKIQDKHILGMIAGLSGSIVKSMYDEVSVRRSFSKVTCREAAVGVIVNSKKEMRSRKGFVLGTIIDAGLCMIGGIIQVHLLSKNGRDHAPLKGAFYGATIAGSINLLLSRFNLSRLWPKDAASNLSFLFGGSLYGIITTIVATKIGHDSLFRGRAKNQLHKPAEEAAELVYGAAQVAK